jgi:hypothetical protein
MTDIVLSSADYKGIHGDIVAILESSRRAAARSVNALMTATYWEVGRRVVAFEQGGENRAAYGRALLVRLSGDLTKRFGRGFGVDNLELMRLFYQTYPPAAISESLIRKSADTSAPPNFELVIRKFDLERLATVFPLSWTHYVHLIRRTRSTDERTFYETEALRGEWSVRQGIVKLPRARRHDGRCDDYQKAVDGYWASSANSRHATNRAASCLR